MATYFTSDLHFGHANIIGYSGRPFAKFWEMDRWLIEAWNDTVGADDVVWVLGDMCMGQLDRTLELVGRLNGDKHLVVGNHDRPFRHGAATSDTKRAWERRYLDVGFCELYHGEVRLDLESVGGVRVCHFPFRGDSQDNDRFATIRPVDDGSVLLHGHVHEKWRKRDRMVNVGVDAWGGRPVSVPELSAAIGDESLRLDPLPWVL